MKLANDRKAGEQADVETIYKKYGRTFYMHAECTEYFKAKLLEGEEAVKCLMF